MNATDRNDATGHDPTTARRADAIVAGRLRSAAAREPLPGKAAGTTAAELAASLSSGSPHAARFTAEIDAAVRGTALALEAARPHPADVWAGAGAFHADPSTWFEQAVLLGHPTHPLARSRGELTDDEIRAYAPEHGARIDLGLFERKGLEEPAIWLSVCGRSEQLPVHPWQAARHGLTKPVRTFRDAAPLMSLRTVSTGDLHIKTAVDLQLTSAVRHVSPASVHNGPLLSRYLAGSAAAQGITLLRERAAIARGRSGEPLSHLAAVVRPAPHTVGHPRAVPLAALAEPDPADGRPIGAALAGDDLDAWWEALVAVALAPVRLFEATGVALEAHGQNALASFTGDRPTGLVYRDFGGVRVPKTGWPALEGDLQTDDADERLRKLTAALFPTTLTALVDALATWTDADPGRWWRAVDRALADLGGSAAQALRTEPWTMKATTAMRLADRPTEDIWVPVDNPLAAA
ncbi:IucA/IucC family protein [Glycomyces sp. YM15]|uniref:IucA/IucC family protein n=1 Tax=Glycomyces sp. YM15 TaxID=2800446 RepID=UPI0019626219|nr:IucA/IucC family protein [Glycomyces sp. YM15]